MTIGCHVFFWNAKALKKNNTFGDNRPKHCLAFDQKWNNHIRKVSQRQLAIKYTPQKEEPFPKGPVTQVGSERHSPGSLPLLLPARNASAA